MDLEDKDKVVELIHSNRSEILKELARLREDRKNLPSKSRRPCVYFASVVRAPRTRKNLSPKLKTKVMVYNVDGGHKKEASIRNLQRNGKFPIGYDFPTDVALQQLKEQAKRQQLQVSGDAVRVFSEEDPYGELRRYLDGQIQILLGGWKSEDVANEYMKRAQEAEEKLQKLLEKDKHAEATADKQ